MLVVLAHDGVSFHPQNSKPGGFMSGLFHDLRATAVGRVLTREDIGSSLEQLRDHLASKNVAFEIAQRLCDGVAERLVGVQLGHFERVGPRVRAALEEACTRLLASGRRVDVLRDALECQQTGKPYVIVFCGVNGVGKSTNLAKVSFVILTYVFGRNTCLSAGLICALYLAHSIRRIGNIDFLTVASYKEPIYGQIISL